MSEEGAGTHQGRRSTLRVSRPRCGSLLTIGCGLTITRACSPRRIERFESKSRGLDKFANDAGCRAITLHAMAFGDRFWR